MFIEYATTNPVFYVSAVVGLIVSITLHELAHGWAAIRCGDETPRRLGHITPDPVTHMGPMSIAAVIVCGIGWGAMPIDPTRLRGKYAEAWVAFAGPLMNLLLAFIALTALALWRNQVPDAQLEQYQMNLRDALWYFGYINIALFIFNLAPIPPLDGSRILANMNFSYNRWVYENQHAAPFLFFAYLAIVMSLSNTKWGLFTIAANAASWYLEKWY